MKKVLPDGCYWARASQGGAWEVLQLRAGLARTVYGESWDADETHEWGPRITPPDEPAPREVDVAALRAVIEDGIENAGDWTYANTALCAALALLAPERREPPALPDGWREVERDDDHMLYESGTTFVDFDRRFGVEAGGLGRRKSQPTIDEMSALVAHHLAARKAGA